MAKAKCSVETCDRLAYGHGMCNMHYQRWRTHGDPLGVSNRHLPFVERFWMNVQKGEPDACWEWTGNRHRQGYGQLSVQGRNRGAHIVSFYVAHGYWPELDVLHSCDNPPCCNPGHLRFDTRQSNVTDMVNRGRNPSQGRKLTAELVQLIRERRANGARQIDLADQFGVSSGEISMIVRGRRWKAAGGPIQTPHTHIKTGA